VGHHLKLLAEEQINQTLYYDHGFTMELRECIHDHFEDLRPVYTKEEFLQVSEHWIEARKEFDRLGQPDPDETKSITLHHFKMPTERMHHQRIALEFTRGGADKDGGGDTMHFHYRHLRIHLSKRDFNILCDTWKQGDKCYTKYASENINLDNVELGQVAINSYIPWLQEYLANPEIPREDPDNFWDMYLESKELIHPADEQRPDGGWFQGPDGKEIRTREMPEEFNRKYLYTMYECIKKYGYGKGPFKYEYVHVQRLSDETYLVRGSHRAACLKTLGYNQIPVVVIN